MKKSEYKQILSKYKNKYSKRILDLRKKYIRNYYNMCLEDFIELNDSYRNLIKSLIKEVIKEFTEYLDMNFIVALNGSLARKTNTLYSDIDLNYLTDSNDYTRIIELEDKVNYILQNVIHYRGKDKIHSFVVYMPLISSKKIKYITHNKYPIVFEDGIIYNKCRKNASRLMFETYNSTRNIYSVIEYLNKNDNIDSINEWSYCFEIIYDNNLSNIYYKNRNIFKSNKNINIYSQKLIKSMSDAKYFDDNIKKIRNCEFKSIYVTSVLENVYALLAIKYRTSLVEKFNIKSFKDSKVLDERFFNTFYEYLKYIQNIQFILDKFGFDLSTHSKRILNVNNINAEYLRLFNDKNFVKLFNQKKRKMYNICIKELKSMK